MAAYSSRKYWWELNLAVEPKMAIARILADLNLAVRYGIAICIYMRVGNFGGYNIDHQTAKSNSPPKFPAIRYIIDSPRSLLH